MDSEAQAASAERSQDSSSARVYYGEGLAAGMIGAATIALWFLILDTVAGRPFYTPTVLGIALFRGVQALAAAETLPTSFEMVIAFTWVHVLAFGILGVVAARLIGLAEKNPNLSFGLVVFFVLFEFGFLAVAMTFGEAVLRALAWPAILVGNLLAAATMGVYLLRRHPNLRMRP